MCGVSMNGCPAARISSQRMSSTSTNTMLGRRGGAAAGAAVCSRDGVPHDAASSEVTMANSLNGLIGARQG